MPTDEKIRSDPVDYFYIVFLMPCATRAVPISVTCRAWIWTTVEPGAGWMAMDMERAR